MLKNKLVLKDLGDPKSIFKGDKPLIVLGTIVGIATGIFSKADGKDPTKIFSGLKGTFEGIPADQKEDAVQSGVLYLPDGIYNMLAANFQGENAATSIQFAIEVQVKKATNPIGYEFGFVQKGKLATADPLASLKEAAGLAKALPALATAATPKK